jgi:hypothetical protein
MSILQNTSIESSLMLVDTGPPEKKNDTGGE